MTRRSAAATAVCVAVCAAVCAAACTKERTGPPDVLLIVMDTTRADRCSFMGYGRPTTPHLDVLAKESVVFLETWSPSSWTVPAHASLFTGQLPFRLGVVGPRPSRMREDVPTLAELLAKAGYETGAFTCNSWIAPHSGLSRGFGTLERIYLDPGGAKAATATDKALGWMKACNGAGKPYFAFINVVEPHLPWAPPAEFEKAFVRPGTRPVAVGKARAFDSPECVFAGLGVDPPDAEVVRAASDLYDAEIAGVDDVIGKLLASMRDADLLDHTMVVVLGDHGEGLGDHGWFEHGTYLHRELVRVPLLIRPAGGCAARTVADLVRVEDVFPTILDACGVPSPSALDALPLLGPPATLAGRTSLAFERTPETQCNWIESLTDAATAAPLRVSRASVSDGRHQLLVDDRGGIELFDLIADPQETRNVASENPEVVLRLRALLDASQK